MGQALRADAGRISRVVAGNESSGTKHAVVSERSKLPAVVGMLATGQSESAPLAALSGASWSRAFQAQRGFDILFQVLKAGPIVGPLIYPALLDLCFLPDAATVLVAGSQEEASGTLDGAGEAADLARRAIALDCTIARVVGRVRNGSGWFLNTLDPPAQTGLSQRCGLQVPLSHTLPQY